MSRTEDELWEQLQATRELPDGRTKIAAVEEVILHADAESLADLQYSARITATRAYHYGGEPAKAFVPFSWCLAARDRGDGNPQLDHSLFWQFKWVCNALPSFPEVPLAQTYAVLDDMERRYRLAGHTMGPVHQIREWVARHIGDRETAAEQYRLWGLAPRGEMSDCAGCEPTSRVHHLAWTGRDAEAVAMAEAVLTGRFTCNEQPQSILTSLLMPYLRTGRLAAAADAHRRAYRAIRGSISELGEVATHVEFCAVTGNYARGLELVQRHLGWLDQPPSPSSDMSFSAAAALVLTRAGETGHDDSPVLRPPFGDRPAAEVSVAALRDELAARALALAERFDARNGTSQQSDNVRETLTAEPIVDFLPLSAVVVAQQPKPVSAPSFPDSADELADLAERERKLSNMDASNAAWRRFDEVLPEPTGLLLARRLNARALNEANRDPETGERQWRQAAELYAEAGDEVQQHAALGRAGLALCLVGQREAGFAEITAEIDYVTALGDTDAQARAWNRLSYAHMVLGEPVDALEAVQKALDLTESDIERAHLNEQAAALLASGDWMDEALQHAALSVEQYRAAGSTEGLARAELTHARMLAQSGELAQAYEVLSAIAPAQGTALWGEVLHVRGMVALDLDVPTEAQEHLSSAVAELTAADFLTQAAYAKIRLATACLRLDLLTEAADAAEEAIPELQRVQDNDETANAQFLLSKVYTRLGHSEQALELLATLTEHCAANDNTAGVGQMRAAAAELLDRLDRDAAAATSYEAAAEAYQQAEWPMEELIYRRRAALSWHWATQPDQAETALAKADELVAALDSDEPQVQWERAMLGYDAARILAGQERLSEALSRILPVADGFRALGATTEAALATTMHGRLLVDLDKPDEAEPVLSQALAELPEDATQQREEVEALLAQLREHA